MKQLDVLVIGEALVDVVTTDAGTIRHPGGSPANVALGLARLGAHTGLLTSLGSDELGAEVAAHLGASGVEILPESFGSWPTSTASVTLDGAGQARYAFDLHWDVPELELARSSVPAVVHTGSIGAFLAPGADRVEHTLRRAAAAGAYVTFDPNIRPMIIGPRESELPRFERLAALASLVKLSDEDAAWLYPGEAPERVLARLLTLGADCAAITLGGEGALLAGAADPGSVVRVDPVRVDVVDTIGAGDTFMAALIAAVVHGGRADDPAELARRGAAAARAAAITVSRAGADLPWAREVADPPRNLPEGS